MLVAMLLSFTAGQHGDPFSTGDWKREGTIYVQTSTGKAFFWSNYGHFEAGTMILRKSTVSVCEASYTSRRLHTLLLIII